MRNLDSEPLGTIGGSSLRSSQGSPQRLSSPGEVSLLEIDETTKHE